MEADFSGWATKNGLKCTDGRTIMPNAFQHQDQMTVPLVWQHGHNDPENVLGHAILENREEGVYAYGFFNDTAKAEHAKSLVAHKDINMLSIWANQLIERSSKVFHGAIREVSLVLSGANPGALIDNITIRHSDDDEQIDEAIIYTGLELERGDLSHGEDEEEPEVEVEEPEVEVEEEEAEETPAVEETEGEAVEHAATNGGDSADSSNLTLADIYNSMTQEQQDLLHFMIGEALDSASAQHSDIEDNNDAETGKEGTTEMKHNVFETKDDTTVKHELSHSDIESIVADASRVGSLKEAVTSYALSHGIDDIDNLFPDAQAIDSVPEFRKRRTEWVNVVLEGVRKSPFARIKTLSADLTFEDARAKGYVKGSLKKEEFFAVAKRVTTPTTIYKKQKLDRDDMIDITDFDVVSWLKGEMRIMLDEEIARAILFSDGRDVSHEDKINEQNVRPIAKDNEVYTTTVNVNLDDASSTAAEIIDALILNRRHLRGSGLPTMFTTESYIAQFMLLKDTTGRRIYKSLDEVAAELRVTTIVAVEAMEEDDEIVAVIVNPIDYVLGADRGGQVSMFDDFDIDYNNYKYLIETRISGALVKLKSALVVKKVAGSVVLIMPDAPTFVSDTGVVTIPTQTGVVYKNAAGSTLSAGAQTAIAAGATVIIYAEPASSSYAFSNDNDDQWAFTREDA